MKARYIGDPRNDGEGPQTLTAFGVTFTKGEWAPVPLAIFPKLRSNSHFEVDDAADPEDRDPVEAEGDIKAAVELLDPANDAHWTRNGLPAVDAVKAILGRDVTRAEIEAAAPGIVRIAPTT